MKSVFKKMRDIGWNLDDFEETFQTHKKHMEKLLSDFEEKEEENSTVHMLQFMIDFLECLEEKRFMVDYGYDSEKDALIIHYSNGDRKEFYGLDIDFIKLDNLIDKFREEGLIK
jgi:hypothetical protein